MANLNLNKVVLGGRLTSDVELKTTTGGIKWVSFSIAVNRPYRAAKADDANQAAAQQQVDYINCIAWRLTAEFISKYFHKGSSICVTGAIQTRSWNDQQGQKRYATEVVVDDAMFVDAKADGTPMTHDAPSYATGSDNGMVTPSFTEMKADDDLPF